MHSVLGLYNEQQAKDIRDAYALQRREGTWNCSETIVYLAWILLGIVWYVEIKQALPNKLKLQFQK